MTEHISLRRTAAAIGAGALITLAWGGLFWAALAPALGVFHVLPEQEQVSAILAGANTESATYFVPWPRDTPAAFAAFEERHKQGGFYKVSYVREGHDPSAPGKMALGVLHYLLIAAAAVTLVRWLGVASFRRRASAVLLGGSLGSLLINVGDPIWFDLPWDYTLATLVNELGHFALLGVAVAFVLGFRKA